VLSDFGNVKLLGAFAAGLISFASPCVLPLVPAYLSFVGGGSFAELTQSGRAPAYQRRLLLRAGAFVAGFIVVFVVLGASATALGQQIADRLGLLEKIAGAAIVLFGLYYIGVVRIPAFSRDVRFHFAKMPAGFLGAFLIGAAFGFGWTPCVGPVLAMILSLAAVQRSVWHGIELLLAYGLGLGVPFLLAAMATAPFLRFVGRVRSRMQVLSAAMGGLMVLTGIAMLTGSLSNVGGWLLQTFPALGKIG
jgi:cytochrome c-type biogenesis protein